MRLLQLGNPATRQQALDTYNFDKGPDNVTSTTTTQPPSYLQGPLQTAANAAISDFNASTGGQYYSPYNTAGQRIMADDNPFGFPNPNPTPLDTSIPGVPGGVPGGAPGGAPGGDFGGFNPIPFLTNQFNLASDLTRGRLDTEFASAGRNLGASQPARSQELQSLAANFFDPNNLFRFNPTNVLIDRLAGITPGAGGVTTSQQPLFSTGPFGF
jgi:hypothetical protein